MITRLTLTVALLLVALACSAQSIDWLPRIPLMQTGWQYPGIAQVIEDSTRNRLMTPGWLLGTVYRSEDNGASWQGQYALGTDVVGKYGQIYVAPDGRYIWHGQTPWNQWVALLSTDGGVTWSRYTSDTLVFQDGGYRGLLWIIPPYNIRAHNVTRTGQVLSSDLGATWRNIQRPPSDTVGWNPNAVEDQAAPNILYYTGKPYLFRFDARVDTVWTETRVEGKGRTTQEVDGGVVTVVSGKLHVYPTWSDTQCRVVRSWKDEETGDQITLSIKDTKRIDDSTVYAYDDRGWIFEIRPRAMQVRCIRPFGKAFPLVSGFFGRASFLWSGVYNGASMSIVNVQGLGWCVAEIKNGRVSRVDTVAPRDPEVITNKVFPLTYFGDRGLFMFLVTTSSFREIVRSTDLGASWIHTSKVEGDQLEPAYLGVRSAVRASDGTLLTHTTRGHCVIPDEPGSIERTFRLDDVSFFNTDWQQKLLYDRATTLYRDGDRMLLTGNGGLCVYDHRRGSATQTILPRKCTFVRSLPSSTMLAGSDSLWITFNSGREWLNVSQTLTSPVDNIRGQFSDATRTASGVLIAAIRGVDYKDTSGRRGVIRYGGIARSIDNGDTWKWITNLPDSMRFVTRVQRVNDSTVLAVAGRIAVDSALNRTMGRFQSEVDASAILISNDEGITWRVAVRDIRTGMQRGDHEPDICVLDNGVVLASLHSGFAFISTTSGRTWSLLDIAELGLGAVHGFWKEDNGEVIISTSVGAGYLRIPGVTSVDTVTPQTTVNSSIRAFVADRMLHLDVPSPQSHLRIMSVDGRCIAERRCDEGRVTIDLTHHPHGIYGVELYSEREYMSTTFIW